MNVINKNLQQLSQLIQSMSMSARITSVLLLVAIVVSLSYLAAFRIAGGETYLYGGRDFSQSELGAMEEALGKDGLNDYEIIGNKIRVPRSQRDRYLRAIAENGASPRMSHEFDELEVSFNPFMSKEQQRNRQKSLTQRRIGEMISDMTGIDYATVHFDESETPGFPRTTVRTAVVTAKAEGTRGLTVDEVDAIRSLAASLSAGLSDTDITIVDSNTSKSYRKESDDGGLLPENNAYTQATRYWERVYREMIEGRLRAYDPNVEVSVKLDPTLMHREHAKTVDSTPVAVSQSTETENSRTVNGGVGGQPGVLANNIPAGGANGSAAISAGQGRESSTDSTSEQIDSVVGATVAEIQRAGMIVESVKVSIGIPRSFYERQWLAQNPTADGAEPEAMPESFLLDNEEIVRKRVQDIVHVLLPQTTQGEDLYKYIVVETDPIPTQIETIEPGMSDHAFSWLAGNWQTIGLLLMGVVGLVMLRGLVKSSMPAPVETDPATGEPATSDGVNAAVTDESEEPADTDNQLLKRFGTSGRSLKEELSELVEQDLDTAANVLKTWIGEAT